MNKTIFFPLYDENYDSDYEKYPVKMCYIEDIYYDSDCDSMIVIDKRNKEEQYYIQMEVEEYNKIMQSLFDSSAIWTNKIGLDEDDFDEEDTCYQICEINKKLPFSVAGTK